MKLLLGFIFFILPFVSAGGPVEEYHLGDHTSNATANFFQSSAEPDSQPENFSCTGITDQAIEITWEEVIGSTPADGYLIRWSSIGFEDIPDPTNGNFVPDGMNDLNIVAGNSMAIASGLMENTIYYFKIFPYTGSGISVEYLTVDAPESSCYTTSSACLSEGFSSGIEPPSGWSFTGIDGIYESEINSGIAIPSLRFDESGDTIETPFLSGPGTFLSFWMRGNGMDPSSSLLVEGYNGSSWIEVETLTNIGNTETIKTYTPGSNPPLPPGIIKYRFSYYKTAGNLAFDDLIIFCETPVNCSPPGPPVTFNAGAYTTSTINLSWQEFDGDFNMVFAAEGDFPDSPPVPETSYFPGTFGSGTPLGNAFAIYHNSPNSCTATGLSPGTAYGFTLYGVNCLAGNEQYSPSGESIMALTRPENVQNFQSVCTTPTTVNLTWNFPETPHDGVLIVAREDNSPEAVTTIDPASTPFNTDFDSAPVYGNNSRILYVGQDNEVTISGLIPGAEYTFKAHAYRIVDDLYSYAGGTQTTKIAAIEEVSDFYYAVNSSSGAELAWVNPNILCFDEVLVVGHTASISGVPDGTYVANSSDFTDPLNPSFPDGGQVLYNGTDNILPVSGLSPGVEYCFKVFVRSGEFWSNGVEVCFSPSDVSVPEQGDLVIVSVNYNAGAGGVDEICMVSFKDITEGTAIDLTDNGYERLNAGQWGDTEGVIRMVKTGTTIPAGTVFCLRGAGNNPNNFTVSTCGSDDPSWEIINLNGTSSFDLANGGDQVWVLSGGNWVNPPESNDAMYTGNVVFGWTSNGWESSPGYNTTNGSTEIHSQACFPITVTGDLNSNKAKYTGSVTDVDLLEWLHRLTNGENWDTFLENDAFYTTSPDYSNDCIVLPFNPSSYTPGLWTGLANNNWFDCRNWGDLKVPNEETNVEIPSTPNPPVISMVPETVAEVRDLVINGALTLEGNDLYVFGDLIKNGTFTHEGGWIHFTGMEEQRIQGNSPLTFQNFNIDKPLDTLILDRIINIQNTLTFTNGVIKSFAGPGLLIFNFGATTSGASAVSYVDGPVRKVGTQNFTFPVGDKSFFRPISISGLTGGFLTFQAEYIREMHPEVGGYYDPPSQPRSTCDYWILDELGGAENAGAYVKITYEIEDECLLIEDPDYLDIHKFNGFTWDDLSTDPNVVGEVITTELITDFSAFVLADFGSVENILPVTWSFFDARLMAEEVQLHWGTESEQNNDFFEVLRSADGEHFNSIGTVRGAGNTQFPRNYSFVDDQPLKGINYYKIKQVDFDGTTDYSDIRFVELPNHHLEITDIRYGENILQIGVSAPRMNTRLLILDMNGREILNHPVAPGYQQLEIHKRDLPTGMYILRLYDSKEVVAEKVFFGT